MLKFLYLLARDFVYLFLRLMLWCFVIFGLALVTKFFWSDGFAMYFETVDAYKANVIKFSALGICGVLSVLVILLSIIKPAQWFAENMFSNQGALTHTLPVPPAFNVISKAISALLMNIIIVLAIVISFITFKEGVAYFEDITLAINDLTMAEGASINIMGVIASGLISLVSLCFVVTASCYLSLSMGQLVAGFRNLFIFVCYCGIFVVSMGIFVAVALNGNIFDIAVIDSMQGMVDFANNIFASVSWTNFVLGIVYNALSAFIITYKLNI